MATTKVRGITIELGADTSGLSKALSSVNKEIGSTQRQLKDVERLLKLDPGNTELLEQKQRLLGESVENTKTKLDALRQAQEEVGRTLTETGTGQEQYDALTREIVSCEQELKKAQKEADNFYVSLEKVGAAGDKIKSVGDKITGVGDKLTKNVTTPIVGLGAAAVKITADFDKSMSQVAAISGATGEDFDKLRDKAREMGEQTKFSAADSADAMNYMAMAGWKTEDMLNGIEGIMNLAAASGEDLATTSDIVTDALTAFGLQAEDSSAFADLLAQTAANANTNVSMMGETFKYAAPVMGAMGYSAEDTALAIGLMGNAGIKASNAGTALRGIVSRMAKPTDEVQMAMDRLGISLYDDEGKMYSFYEIMEQMRAGFGQINMPVEEFESQMKSLNGLLESGELTEKKYNDAVEELTLQAFGAEEAEKARAAAMLAGKNALSGLLAIVNASDEDFNNLKTAIDSSNGAAQNMAEIMQDNASGQMEILMSQLQELAISFGDILIPIFRDGLTIIQDLVDKFNGLDESQQKTILKIAGVVAAIGPALSIFGRLTSTVGTVMSIISNLGPVITGLGTAFEFLTGPIGIAIAAIAAIAIKGDEIQAKLQELDDWLQGVFATDFTEIFGDTIGGELNDFVAFVKEQWDAIKKIFDGIIDFIRGVFTGDWERAWTGIKEIFGGIFDSLVSLAKMPINGVIKIINGAINGINKIIDKIDSISFDLPELLGGGHIGFNIGRLSTIPLLAKGGTVTNGTAIVGEAGAELLQVSNGAATVKPLTNGNAGSGDITGLLEKYLPYLAQKQGLYLDGDTLVGETIDRINLQLGELNYRERNR